jgi:hypothetical protein
MGTRFETRSPCRSENRGDYPSASVNSPVSQRHNLAGLVRFSSLGGAAPRHETCSEHSLPERLRSREFHPSAVARRAMGRC